MSGINSNTGRSLDGIEHLKQSINNILGTPIGSRVMRRYYGSRLFELVDAPMTRSTLVSLYASTAEAIATWEPRFALRSVTATENAPGHVQLSLTGRYRPSGKSLSFDVTPNMRPYAVTPDTLTHVIGSEYMLSRVTTDVRPEYGRVDYE